MPPRRPRRTSTLGEIMRNAQHYRARYTRGAQTHTPGHTFPSYELADQWLAAEQLLIARDEWTPPATRRAQAEAAARVETLTLGEYAEQWIATRRVRGRELRPRTAEHYRDLVARWFPPLTSRPVAAITRAEASAWFLALPDRPTMRKHAYDLLRSVFASAVRDGLIERNPVDIPGASAKVRPRRFVLPTGDQVQALADAMPPEHRLAVLLAAWCGLRFGEVVALRRSDFTTDDTGATVMHVRRGVVRVANRHQEGPTKTDAGARDILLTPDVAAEVRTHLARFAQWGADGLLFPSTRAGGDYLTEGQLMGHAPVVGKGGKVTQAGNGFRGARAAVGLDSLTFHGLRHFAGTHYRLAGATDRELLDFMGHTDLHVALRYQQQAQSRAEQLAARMAVIARADRGATS